MKLGANESFKRARNVNNPVRPGAGHNLRLLQSRRLKVNANQIEIVMEEDMPKASAKVELSREEAETIKNMETLERDFKQGLVDILELHNTDELRELCLKLGLNGAGSKKCNLTSILESINPEAVLERECVHILKFVWDGVVIEYLRNERKNLMKCRDNLRGAVVSHWKRNTVAVANTNVVDECCTIPVYMYGTAWVRTNCTSAADERVHAFLKALHVSELELKECEKQLRIKPDYSTVVMFLNKIQRTRMDEATFRADMFKLLQELLGERDVLLGNEKTAVADARESRQAIEAIVKHARARSFFRGIDDALQQDSQLEKLRTQVELVHREKDIERLHDEMKTQRLAFEAEKARLKEIISVTTVDLHQMREAFQMAHENYDQNHKELREMQKMSRENNKLFKVYREDAQAYYEKSMHEYALECAKHQVSIAAHAHTISKAQCVEHEFRDELDVEREVSQARLERAETWEMTCADLEVRQYELQLLLMAARSASTRPASTNSRQSAGNQGRKTLQTASGEKKKGARKVKSPSQKRKKNGKRWKDKKNDSDDAEPASPDSPTMNSLEEETKTEGGRDKAKRARGKHKSTVRKMFSTNSGSNDKSSNELPPVVVSALSTSPTESMIKSAKTAGKKKKTKQR